MPKGWRPSYFGDVPLADVRAHREGRLAETAIEPLFPLWGSDSAHSVEKMLAAGLRAVIACLDPSRLDPALAGAELTREVVGGLPAHVDPWGENGEFHTFAFAGPMFRHPVAARTGACLHRDGFCYADILPAEPAPE